MATSVYLASVIKIYRYFGPTRYRLVHANYITLFASSLPYYLAHNAGNTFCYSNMKDLRFCSHNAITMPQECPFKIQLFI